MSDSAEFSSLPSAQIDILWNRALTNDDAKQARKLFSHMGDGSHPFQEILLFDGPRPVRVMDAALEAGLLNRPDWLLIAFEHAHNANKGQDWDGLFDWYCQHVGYSRWRNDVVTALEHVCRKCAYNNSKDFIAAALDRDPSLVKEIAERGRLAWLVMFSMSHHEREWLDRAPIPLDDILNEAWMVDALTHVFSPVTTGSPPLFDAWVSHSPQRQQAWETIQRQDRQRETLLDGWFNQWVPGDTWQGSPLDQWYQRPLDHKLGVDDPAQDPTAHPAMGPWAQQPAAERHAIAHKRLEARLLVAGGPGRAAGITLIENLRQAINEMCRPNVLGQVQSFWGHHDTAVDPLAILIKHGRSTSLKSLPIPDVTTRLYALINQDRRGAALLSKLTVSQAVEMMISDPAWQSWKNHQGASLLDIALDMTRTHRVGSHTTRLSRGEVLKLDKTFPGLLTAPNRQGEILLNRLDITPAVRRTLVRKALKTVAGSRLRRSAPKPKM